MSARRYVAVVGAVNMDICGRPLKKLIFRDSNPGTVRLTPGGVGRNIAHNLRLLGENVTFLTVFGEDAYAETLRRDCAALGMDLSCAETIRGGRTSSYLYITDEHGEMQLGLSDTDISSSITPDYLASHLDVLNGAAAVVMDGNLTEETISWLGAHCTAPLFADPVSVTKAERMRASLGRVHTFKPNLTEGQNLTGETEPEAIARAMLAQGVQRVFLSMGPDGILAAQGDALVHLPCLPTRLVNTTGGGDAVMAALVWSFVHGLDLRASAAAALRAGKCTVEYNGTNNPALSPSLLTENG
ncbi:MAG: PfkB family carbohydrate kinase [Oscillospiraceae bacterium]